MWLADLRTVGFALAWWRRITRGRKSIITSVLVSPPLSDFSLGRICIFDYPRQHEALLCRRLKGVEDRWRLVPKRESVKAESGSIRGYHAALLTDFDGAVGACLLISMIFRSFLSLRNYPLPPRGVGLLCYAAAGELRVVWLALTVGQDISDGIILIFKEKNKERKSVI